jgi:hypothetical protein
MAAAARPAGDGVSWGPFAPTIGPGERVARLRELRAVVRLVAGPGCAVLPAIGRALSAPGGLEEIEDAIGGLAPLTRRRVLAVFAELAKERMRGGWAMVEIPVPANANKGDPLVEALRRQRADVVEKMRASAATTGRVDAGWTTLLAAVQTALAAIEDTRREVANG